MVLTVVSRCHDTGGRDMGAGPMMGRFKQHLDRKLVGSLNEQFRLPGQNWWKDTVQRNDVAIGFRNRSMNVYVDGQSVFRISRSGTGTLSAVVHWKFLRKLGLSERPPNT